LQKAIKTCSINLHPLKAPPTVQEVSNLSRQIYGTLSNQIHGSPWEATVEVSDQLDPLERCVVLELCKDFGLL
jgi:hypothetical protein